MKRLLTLWLTLLAALWLTRTAVSALLFQQAAGGFPAVFVLVTVPLLQTLAVGWVTRSPGPPPWAGLEVRRRRLVAGLLAGDAAALLLALLFESDLPPAAWAGLQAAGAAVLLGLAARRGAWNRSERSWLGLLAFTLVLFALAVLPGLEPLQDLLFPGRSPLFQRLAVEAPALVLAAAALLACREILARESAAAGTLLDAALGLGLTGALLEVLTLIPEAPLPVLWAVLAWACRLLAATSLATALALVRAPGPPESSFDPAEGVVP
jgi:hypothetical protein